MLKKFALAAATASVLVLGTFTSAGSSQAAAIGLSTPAVQSNVIDAACWRGRHGRLHCNGRRWHRHHHRDRHCWWRHGTRHCVWR